jgi:hypothetical protein
MSAKDKPVKHKYYVQYRPVVRFTVEEFEDGTFNVDKFPHIDWDDSYESYYNVYDVDQRWGGILPDAVWTGIDSLIDTLAIREYYQAWTPEDEPF